MRGRLIQGLSGFWGAVVGVMPHVLHHAGPLAGAALLAGLGGRIAFFILGLAAAVPFLRRLYRRFGTWLAPSIAIGVFAVTYTASSVVLGPLIADRLASNPADPAPVIAEDHHDGH